MNGAQHLPGARLALWCAGLLVLIGFLLVVKSMRRARRLGLLDHDASEAEASSAVVGPLPPTPKFDAGPSPHPEPPST